MRAVGGARFVAGKERSVGEGCERAGKEENEEVSKRGKNRGRGTEGCKESTKSGKELKRVSEKRPKKRQRKGEKAQKTSEESKE